MFEMIFNKSISIFWILMTITNIIYTNAADKPPYRQPDVVTDVVTIESNEEYISHVDPKQQITEDGSENNYNVPISFPANKNLTAPKISVAGHNRLGFFFRSNCVTTVNYTHINFTNNIYNLTYAILSNDGGFYWKIYKGNLKLRLSRIEIIPIDQDIFYTVYKTLNYFFIMGFYNDIMSSKLWLIKPTNKLDYVDILNTVINDDRACRTSVTCVEKQFDLKLNINNRNEFVMPDFKKSDKNNKSITTSNKNDLTAATTTTTASTPSKDTTPVSKDEPEQSVKESEVPVEE